jgi:hypothetical protein
METMPLIGIAQVDVNISGAWTPDTCLFADFCNKSENRNRNKSQIAGRS